MNTKQVTSSMTSVRASLGLAPAILARRAIEKPEPWYKAKPVLNDFDPMCDPYNPKTIYYTDVVKAYEIIKKRTTPTRVVKAKAPNKLYAEVFFKLEMNNKTGSFHNRSAMFALHMLTPEQHEGGVYTATLDNWGMAIAYEGSRLDIPVTIVFPKYTAIYKIEKCRQFGAHVVIHGETLEDARCEALRLMKESGTGTFINGSDHPHVIAAAGTIAIELLQQLPSLDAVLVPVGGGGLLAGVAAVIKKLKPNVLVYGIQAERSCCFFKALAKERPYRTECALTIAHALMEPTAGCNAFYTARSLIDKMVLVKDDAIVQALLQLVEVERIVAEGSGSTSVAPFFSVPNLIPELRDKTVACIITGGNIDYGLWSEAIERALALDGRLVSVRVKLPADDQIGRCKLMSIISAIGSNITTQQYTWDGIVEDEINDCFVAFKCEVDDFKMACTLKRVLNKLYPGRCEFSDVPFHTIWSCPCYPKIWPELL